VEQAKKMKVQDLRSSCRLEKMERSRLVEDFVETKAKYNVIYRGWRELAKSFWSGRSFLIHKGGKRKHRGTLRAL